MSRLVRLGFTRPTHRLTVPSITPRRFLNQSSKQAEIGRVNLNLSENVRDYVYDIPKKVINLYGDMTGLPPVRVAQEQVLIVQDKLKEIQEKRRPIMMALNEIRDKIQSQNLAIQSHGQRDHSYLKLIQENIAMNQEEKRLMEFFKTIDEEERTTFMELTNSVKRSHELERIQSEQSKFLMMIFSLVFSIIGAVTYQGLLILKNSDMEKKMKSETGVITKSTELLLEQYFGRTKSLFEEMAEQKKSKTVEQQEGWIWWACKPVVKGIKALKFW